MTTLAGNLDESAMEEVRETESNGNEKEDTSGDCDTSDDDAENQEEDVDDDDEGSEKAMAMMMMTLRANQRILIRPTTTKLVEVFHHWKNVDSSAFGETKKSSRD
ncbi:hypothetical protein MHU86_15417 [Fragilaria crotonensis]|nr:hypothetical protein MHU86_15417 [Fragilaria crotonensis]